MITTQEFPTRTPMRTHVLLPLALAMWIAIPSSSVPAPHDLTDAERARVTSEATDFLASYLEVIEGGDTDAIRALFVEDERFAWFTDGEKRYASVDDLLAGLASMKGMTFSTEVSEVEVVPLAPDLAHARTAFQTKLSQGGAVVFEYGGVITWVLEDVKDSGWRVLTGHTSTPKER